MTSDSKPSSVLECRWSLLIFTVKKSHKLRLQFHVIAESSEQVAGAKKVCMCGRGGYSHSLFLSRWLCLFPALPQSQIKLI